MGYSATDGFIFASLFHGNETAYGVTTVGEIVDGKAKSTSKLVHSQVTLSTYENHLQGKQSIGIAPITDEDQCSFGAIDIDNYDGDIYDIVTAIWNYKIPLFPCLSKSKKLHIYMFVAEPVSCSWMTQQLRFWANAFGCDPKTEIFPKQQRMSATSKFASWINLPYFDANSDNPRKLIGLHGELKTLSEAMEYGQTIQLSAEEHEQWFSEFTWHSAPMCVLTGVLLRNIPRGHRNEWFFNLGVYVKLTDPENFDDIILSVNDSLKDPLPESELRATIIEGFKRKSYSYHCKAALWCNRKYCTESGIKGTTGTTGLDYGQLTQVMADPPYYKWEVSGVELTFNSEHEIISQTKMRNLCLRHLHILPQHISDEAWTAIVNKALKNIVVDEVSLIADDASVGSQFLNLLGQYFTSMIRTQDTRMLTRGFVCEDGEKYYFSMLNLVNYITVVNKFYAFTGTEIQLRLSAMGAEVDKDKWCWSIPKDRLPYYAPVNTKVRDELSEVKVEF